MITAAQCRAARAWLDLTQSDLAEMVGCGLTTILDFETGRRRTLLENVLAMQRVLEERGIVFIRTPEIGRFGIEGPE
jgi:DNA-binding XRE family transcriptional regulator